MCGLEAQSAGVIRIANRQQAAHLLSQEAEALFGAHKLKRLAQQRVEGLGGAAGGAAVRAAARGQGAAKGCSQLGMDSRTKAAVLHIRGRGLIK